MALESLKTHGRNARRFSSRERRVARRGRRAPHFEARPRDSRRTWFDELTRANKPVGRRSKPDRWVAGSARKVESAAREKQTEAGFSYTVRRGGGRESAILDEEGPCARTVSRKSALAPVVWPGSPPGGSLSFAITFPNEIRRIYGKSVTRPCGRTHFAGYNERNNLATPYLLPRRRTLPDPRFSPRSASTRGLRVERRISEYRCSGYLG